MCLLTEYNSYMSTNNTKLYVQYTTMSLRIMIKLVNKPKRISHIILYSMGFLLIKLNKQSGSKMSHVIHDNVVYGEPKQPPKELTLNCNKSTTNKKKNYFVYNKCCP